MDKAITLTKTLKQQRVIRDILMAEAGLTSWDEAVTVLPEGIHMYKEKEDVTYSLCFQISDTYISTLANFWEAKGMPPKVPSLVLANYTGICDITDEVLSYNSLL